MLRVRQRVAHLVRAAVVLARDQRIPRPLRALLLLGLAPIPGPFDEALLVVLVPVLVVFYRTPLTDAWRRTAAEGSGDGTSGERPVRAASK